MRTLNLNKFPGAEKHVPSFKERTGISFINAKWGNPIGVVFIFLFALILAGLIAYFGPVAALFIAAVIIGLPLAYAVVTYPKFGIISLLVFAYIVLWVNKFNPDFPAGTLLDGLQVLLIAGFFIKHKYDKSWDFAKNPVSVMILIWIGYSLLEVANPVAASQLAWVFTVRTVATVMLMCFIFMYHVRSVSFIRLLLKIWIGLSVFAALYSFKQEYFGFFSFEKTWLNSDPVYSTLYLINGHWRKFSIFSDPMQAAYNMVISSLLCITLMFGPFSKTKKLLLGVFSIAFILAMLHTGTRAAFILIPAGLGMFLLLRFTKRTFLFTAIAGMIFLTLIRIHTANPLLSRFQSAFYPSVDASFNVRKINQKRIQPYIQTHPIGGGLGSSGAWGQRFSPGSYLASFPPDSGYVRVAVEMGWVGLLLQCTLFFIVLKTGIENYFKIHDAELKNYCLAMILIVFALSIGNYPQEALVQYPINILLCLAMALINITLKLDREKENKDADTFKTINSLPDDKK